MGKMQRHRQRECRSKGKYCVRKGLMLMLMLMRVLLMHQWRKRQCWDGSHCLRMLVAMNSKVDLLGCPGQQRQWRQLGPWQIPAAAGESLGSC